MRDVLTTFVPLGLFMLIPIWIPLVALLVGTVLDWLRPPQRGEAGTDRSKH